MGRGKEIKMLTHLNREITPIHHQQTEERLAGKLRSEQFCRLTRQANAPGISLTLVTETCSYFTYYIEITNIILGTFCGSFDAEAVFGFLAVLKGQIVH